jgi:BirA family transcriptional regulator, biotin operon repressor / biotin---[acetyl-CoA-carboxylase] ligase
MYVSECSSTMDIGKDLVSGTCELSAINCFTELKEAQDKDYFFVFASRQNQGRGRRERTWESSSEQGMYFTLVDKIPRRRDSLSGLSLVIGFAVHESLSRIGVPSALKWPNDVLCNYRPYEKLSGVLVETFPARSPEYCYILSGVGVNINQEFFPEDVPASSIRKELGKEVHYEMTCMNIANTILTRYKEFLETGFAPFQSLWWDASLHHNSMVTSEHPPLEGRVEGVSEDGALLVRSSGRIHSVVSGDVIVTHHLP